MCSRFSQYQARKPTAWRWLEALACGLLGRRALQNRCHSRTRLASRCAGLVAVEVQDEPALAAALSKMLADGNLRDLPARRGAGIAIASCRRDVAVRRFAEILGRGSRPVADLQLRLARAASGR